jgi:hypothetical protein
MTDTTDWDLWRGSWQTQQPTSLDLDEAMARFEHARRRDSTIRVIEWVIVGLAVVFPIVAMRHAANLIEATLGIGAAIIVLGVAALRHWNRRAERTALGASARDFDHAVRSMRLAEFRFVRFLWLVLGLEGVFATVWWYGGIAAHHSVFAPIAFAMLWLPLTVVAATMIWSVRLRADALRELSALRLRETTRTSDD